MRGIAECIKWMVEHPGEKLTRTNRVMHRWYDNQFGRIVGSNGISEYDCFVFLGFEEHDWLPLKKTYTFLEAFNDCLATGQKYRCLEEVCENQIMKPRDERSVWVKDEIDNSIVCVTPTLAVYFTRLTGEWVKE